MEVSKSGKITRKQYLQVGQYKKRFGCYPRVALADRIYCARTNRAMLKIKGIGLRTKPLERPPALSIPVSPGERNSIERKFGKGKAAYGLNSIRARLKQTSESWIAGIFMVLNLVKLTGCILLCAAMNFLASCKIVYANTVVGTELNSFLFISFRKMSLTADPK